MFALFLSACTGSMQTFIQTNNEGIFLHANKNQSFSLHINNPSKLNTNLEAKLAQKLQNLGLVLNNVQSDYKNLYQYSRF